MSETVSCPDEQNSRRVALSDCRSVFDAVLDAGGEVTFSPKGASMLPMLRAYGDEVTLVKPPSVIKTGSVALFVYRQSDGTERYILHRLVRKKHGSLIFCGDNRFEHDAPIAPKDVVGVVTGCKSRGKTVNLRGAFYRVYSAWMVITAGLKRPAIAIGRFVYRIWKRLKK